EAAHPMIEPAEAAGEPEGDQQREVEGRPEEPEAGPHASVLLRARVAIGIVNTLELRWQCRVERAQVQNIGRHPAREFEEQGGEDDQTVDVHRVTPTGRGRWPPRARRRGWYRAAPGA